MHCLHVCLQILTVLIASLHRERKLMIARRVELTNRLLRSCLGAADEYLSTCVDEQGLFSGTAKRNLSVVVGGWVGFTATDRTEVKPSGYVLVTPCFFWTNSISYYRML